MLAWTSACEAIEVATCAPTLANPVAVVHAILTWGLAKRGLSYANHLHEVVWGPESKDSESISDGDTQES